MHCDSKRRQKSLELYGWNGLKSQKFIAQGNGYKQHALKGQKLLAQGSALGIVTVSNAPCKGKSFINFRVSFKAFALTGRQVCEHDNPGRCPGLRASAPSGRAACVHLLWDSSFLLSSPRLLVSFPLHSTSACRARMASNVPLVFFVSYPFLPKSAGISPHFLVSHFSMGVVMLCVRSQFSPRAMI